MSRAVAIVSPRFDAIWFVGPGVVAAIGALAIGRFAEPGQSLGLVGWIALVLLVDVAHVWATLYRTYLDPGARVHHRRRLWLIPAMVAWFGVLLHLESPVGFWTVMAYLAIFHFIMQHVGFAMMFARKGAESDFDRRLIKVAVWAATAAPVVWWHGNLPRAFAWFASDDLITGLPAEIGTVALVLEVAVLATFCVRRVQLRRAGARNPMVAALVLVPALNWYLGIVAFDDDRIFTLTNVLMHGVPYLALVWIAGGRRTVTRWSTRRAATPGIWALLSVYVGGLVILATVEEALWDRLIWHDHSAVFGAPIHLEHPLTTAVVVALLSVPQTTHYLLDRWIWRVGPDNPELAAELAGDRGS